MAVECEVYEGQGEVPDGLYGSLVETREVLQDLYLEHGNLERAFSDGLEINVEATRMQGMVGVQQSFKH